jgi:hypothetical protein
MLVYLLLAYSLVASFVVVFGTFKEENDALYGLVLWKELKSHGFDALHSWSYAADSFLFPLLIIQIPFFVITNDATWSPILVGYLIFVAQAVIVGLMVHRQASRQLAILSIAVMLSLNQFVHLQMFASYATSHNVSHLVGLLAFYILSAETRSRYFYKEVGVLIVLAFTSISDPWTIAVFTLPLIAALAYLIGISRKKRINNATILAATLACFAISKTNLFGLVSFIPPNELDVRTRLKILIVHRNWESLVYNFGVFKKTIKEIFIPNVFIENGLIEGGIFLALSISLILVFAIFSLRQKGNETNYSIVVLFAVVSITATFFAFLIGPTAGSGGSRWLINIPYLLFLVIVLGAGKRDVVKSAKYLVVFAMWIVVFSSLSIFRMNLGVSTADEKTQMVIDFLEKEHQVYGFGPYWGTNANVIALATDGERVIRPIRFDSANSKIIFFGRPATSESWYTDADLPDDTPEVFFLLAIDDEECATLPICRKIVIEEFGTPLRTAVGTEMVMLVYDIETIRKTR